MELLTLEPSARKHTETEHIPPLENGDCLTAAEFLRRYEAMPDVKKAELIEGIVYMASPVSMLRHGVPDMKLHLWLSTYSYATPLTLCASNSTNELSLEDVPQPDALMILLPEFGGATRMNARGYLCGPPELVIEIASGSKSIDLGRKLRAYERAGVPEYIVWRTVDVALDWLVLEGKEYRPLRPAADGTLRSRIFPGLWLDRKALLDGDMNKVMSVLRKGLRSTEHSRFVKRSRAQK